MRNMTLVEFYDDKALENISGTLYLKPDKVIYLGSRGNKLKRFTGYCREVLKDLGLKTEVEYRTINPNSLDFMINVLSDILRENEVCEFNLTGGEETVLVALGIVYERFPNRVQLHKINLNTGMFLDMDGDNSHGWDGTVPGLSVENLVRIYGGSVIHSGSAQPGSEDFVWDQKFCKAVRDMWNLCRGDCGRWNIQIANLELAQKYGGQENSLQVNLRKDSEVRFDGDFIHQPLFGKLCERGYIQNFTETDTAYRYAFRDEQIKQCLTKAGMILELAVCLAAKSVKEDGKPFFQDVKSGVYLDWDSALHDTGERVETVNEIDVIMMHNLIPVFASCKNGNMSVDELYKLKVVAERFGLGYARKILVLTDYAGRHQQNFAYIRERAEDMNIMILRDVHQLSIQKLGMELKKICQ